MSNNHDQEMELLLDRHIDSLRSDRASDGPSTQVIEDTLAMLRVTGTTSDAGDTRNVIGRPIFFERLIRMALRHRFAAAVTMTIGAAAVFVVLMLFHTVPPSLAFADVAEKLRSARTLSFLTTTKMGGLASLLVGPMKLKTVFATPDRMRLEFPEGTVSIFVGHISLMLDPRLGTATRTENVDASGQPAIFRGPMNKIEALCNIPPDSGEPVADKVIDGVEARGIRARHQGMTITFWADKKTAMPILIEAKKDEVSLILDHFVIDAPIDDALFSLEVPEGYKLTTKKEGPVPEKIEDFVGEMIQGYAEVTDGSLPAKLNDWSAFNKVAKKDPKGRLDRIGALSGRLSQLDDYGYTGKGVKLGEKDKIVFWYRSDSNTPTYRALYGDLRVADVTRDKLPTTKPTDP
jgi:outer membrane lipoprotein-sorting protein